VRQQHQGWNYGCGAEGHGYGQAGPAGNSRVSGQVGGDQYGGITAVGAGNGLTNGIGGKFEVAAALAARALDKITIGHLLALIVQQSHD